MHIQQVNFSQAALLYDLFNQYRIFYKQPSNIDLAKSFIDERLANNESIIFVALAENKTKPVGFTQLYPSYSSMRAIKNWILNDLYVDVDFRKQGIGEQLINTAFEFAKRQQAKFVQLSTAIDNYTAQGLYEKIGFIKQEPETAFFTYTFNLI